MPTDPEVLPPQSFPDPGPEPGPPVVPQLGPQPEPQIRPQRRIPSLGNTLLFLIVVAAVLFATEIVTFSIATVTHIFGRETPQQLLREPRLIVPTMAISYLAGGAIVWAIFSHLWGQPFWRGLRWNSTIVVRHLYLFLGLGIALSITVQLLSNYLPIPKTLPIDDFFRTPADVWLVAIFGTFLAPPFEEMAFRGFLLPSLATAWDWGMDRLRGSGAKLAKDTALPIESSVFSASSVDFLPLPAAFEARPAAVSREQASPERDGRDPRWSTGALVFSCIVTSIGFAMLHADQLAHSLAPLSVLFAVSIVLCLVRLRAHSLAASSLIHAAYNGTIFVLVFYATDGFRHLDKMTH